MEEKKKIRPQPGVTGVIISALLIASRFFGSADSVALRSMNTVLVLVMLVFCLHLVRGTSLWRQPHVWNAWNTLALFLMPLVMLLITALQNQDMYLAGSIVFIMGILAMVGTLVSDILLAVTDPRIRNSM